MIKFLLQRPIAVLMAFTACFIVGLTTYFTLPVSLLPNIAIPEITVQVTGQNTSARELENTVVKPIRQQLMQVNRLQDIQSDTRDGYGLIRLSFDFGTNTDLAFIEVNEKIDAAMNYLPRETGRPRVIKASATDIPVFCLNLTLKNDLAYESYNEERFLELCEFAETVIKRRIEQLPAVAMADITGVVGRQLQIVPDMNTLQMADITIAELENALTSNNIDFGSMKVRDGYYEYNIKFSTLLRTTEDVQNIYIRKNDRIFRLKELADISVVPVKESGSSLSGGKRAVTLAIIKQSEENMDRMKEELEQVTSYFSSIYPEIDFTVTRNQTELLDFAISNLKQNLLLAFILIFVVATLFLSDVKSPLVIALSMLVSIVVSFLFFYLFQVSLNIISLSGLILALGMMIDNSIIVTENIVQYRSQGYTLDEACDKGTTEVITPMLSSTFTTIAVFVPLIFLSGIAGAIFNDQAFAVTVGLLVSYITGIMLLPVLYKLIYSIPEVKSKWINFTFNNPIKAHTLDRYYDAGINFIFRHKTITGVTVLLTIPVCFFLFYQVPKSRMPEIEQNELIALVEWNENIHPEENRNRVNQLFQHLDALQAQHTAYIGIQQFLLNRDRELSSSEAELYFKTEDTSGIPVVQETITAWINQHYPSAVFSFAPPETVFEKIFVTGEADLVAGFYPRNRSISPDVAEITTVEKEIIRETGIAPVGIAFEKQINITIDRERVILYNIDYNEIYRLLRTAFKENEVATLRSYQQYLPITIAGQEQTIREVLANTLIRCYPENSSGPEYIPLQYVVRTIPDMDIKTITAGKNGEYIPFRFYDIKQVEKQIDKIKQVAEIRAGKQTGGFEWDVEFSGNYFSNRKMLSELVVILLISILLMYFILAAQFESFMQPLIVLLEIPIDVAFALLVLWITGHTLNLMSAIGIVVTCGIIINDSILKLDAINELRKAGIPLMEAIHEAGRRRLRPIIMTSLTTIFAMVPLLFSHDMGSELQQPLAIAMIAAMVVGTLVSLFIVPLIYWFIYRHEKLDMKNEK